VLERCEEEFPEYVDCMRYLPERLGTMKNVFSVTEYSLA
jgi:hypothetical protein